MKERSEWDPKGLIREAFRIEGITREECRSIFLDWALSMPADVNTTRALNALLAQYAGAGDDHPMTQVMTEGLTTVGTPRRRGGWRSRPRH